MNAEELNDFIRRGWVNTLVRVAEAKQVKTLSRIADDICIRQNVRLVLIAGASSAGKTTTAKRVCTQLMVNDRFALHLSTDDYFVGDRLNPRDENGELDYEHVLCVDIPRLAADMSALFRGDAIPERRFDFIRHEPTYTENYLQLPKGGFIVLEGIHALNPKLTEDLAEDLKFRIYVDPKPTLELAPEIQPTSADARFLRRLVRDNQFRKMDTLKTLSMWQKVLDGEKKWIEPFHECADVTFNSYLVYELAALKYYVEGLLEIAHRGQKDDPRINRGLAQLRSVLPISHEAIPGNSILRETIGGSQLEY